MTPSKEELLAIARQYWRPDKDYELRQERSPEHDRLEARWEEALEEHHRWHALLDDLEQELPGFTLGDGTATPDACFRCVAYPVTHEKGQPLPPYHWIVVGCLSILAPIYIVYGVEYGRVGRRRLNPRVSLEPLLPERQAVADVLSRKIEERFGASKLPRDIAETPVPLYAQWVEPPETTLFHVLFTNEPGNVP
ncbi:hypothetical protein [Archangium violaceum]|uniref:hypothetical protein n=1 Tax=Archangium violaceum TaxID=83451 RepID=UPI001EF484CC|nr:hypothetical protein [Archangium violaceum]